MVSSILVNSLANSSIVASLLVITILIVKSIFRKKINAKWHYIIWFALILRLAVPYMINSPFNIQDFYKENEVMSQADRGFADNAASDNRYKKAVGNTFKADNPIKETGHTEKKVFSPVASLRKLISFVYSTKLDTKLLFYIWLLGLSLLSSYYFLNNIFFWIKVKNGTVFTNNDVIRLLEKCKEKLGVRTNISIIQTSGVSIPAIFGITRPWLLLPEKVLKNLEYESLRYVILHELAHLKRKDIIVNWISLILQIVYWFNPIIWIAFCRMRFDRELACDETVLMHLSSGKEKKYGHTILNMVEIISGRLSFAGTAGILENKSQIKDRISMISRFNGQSSKYPVFAVVVLIILTSSIFVNACNLKAPKPRDQKSGNNNTDAVLTYVKGNDKKYKEIQAAGGKERSTLPSNNESKNIELKTTDKVPDNPKSDTSLSKKPNKTKNKSSNSNVKNSVGEEAIDTSIEEPYEEDSDVSADNSASTAINVKNSSSNEIVPIYQGKNGTVTKLNEPVLHVNSKKDEVYITRVEPNKDLQEGVETKITVDVEYSLVSMENTQFAICSNIQGYRSTSQNAIQVSVWEIPKGIGKYRFTVSVTPKHWDDGTPFWVVASLYNSDNSWLTFSQYYNLELLY